MDVKNRVVSVIKCRDYKLESERVDQAIAALEDAGGFNPKVDTVFIKPNIAIAAPSFHTPDGTEPDLVAALVRYFYNKGAKKVYVGESPAWGACCQDAYRASGLDRATLDNGGILYDIDNEPHVTVPVDGYVMKEVVLPKAVVEADLVVNVPKAKMHFLTGVTLGIKNLYGCMRYMDRKKYHREADLAYVLADLCKAIKPGLTVIDAVRAMEGFGPHAGTEADMGLIIAGADPLAVDAVGATLMGVDPKSLAMFQVAQKLGLGTIDLADIRVVGEDPDDVGKSLAPPLFKYVSNYENVDIHAGGICPGCKARISSVPTNIDKSKKYAVIIGREPIAIRSDIEADEIWLVGNCGVRAGMAYLLRSAFMGGFKKGMPKVVKIPGCPPLDWFSEKVVFPDLRKKGWMSLPD